MSSEPQVQDVSDPVGKAQQIAYQSARADIGLRIAFGITLIVLFLALNGAVIGIVWHLIGLDDAARLANKDAAYDPVINSQVVMSLVGGTVVQGGTAVAVIIGSLFKKPR